MISFERVNKMKIHLTVLLVTLTLLLCACGAESDPSHITDTDSVIMSNSASVFNTSPTTVLLNTEESSTTIASESRLDAFPSSPISAVRDGVLRWGLSRYFTYSESGIYTIIWNQSGRQGGAFAVYCNMHADSFVKLCSRPDCMHEDADCNAFLGQSNRHPLYYYKGYVYFIVDTATQFSQKMDGSGGWDNNPPSVWRMDPDGNNKTFIFHLMSKEEWGGGLAYGGTLFTNGFVQMSFYSVAPDGEMTEVIRTYSLDSPDSNFNWPANVNQIMAYDGESILINGAVMRKDQNEKGTPLYSGLYRWDEDRKTFQTIGDWPLSYGIGWYGTKNGYLFHDGRVCLWDYSRGNLEPLFETGLKGKKDLYAFPDCIMLTDLAYDVFNPDLETPDHVQINLYDWDYNMLGKCNIETKDKMIVGGIVFGETTDRILFTLVPYANYPTHYINKSDFGKEVIPVYKYHYPEIDLTE